MWDIIHICFQKGPAYINDDERAKYLHADVRICAEHSSVTFSWQVLKAVKKNHYDDGLSARTTGQLKFTSWQKGFGRTRQTYQLRKKGGNKMWSITFSYQHTILHVVRLILTVNEKKITPLLASLFVMLNAVQEPQ